MIGFLRLPALNSVSCLTRYSGCWPCDDRVGRAAARAVGGVAGGADLGRDGLALGQVGLGGGLAASAADAAAPAQAASSRRTSSRAARLHVGQRGVRDAKPGDFTMTLWAPHDRPTTPADAARPPADADKPALAWTHTARFLTTASQLDQLPADRAARDRLRRPLQRRQVDRDQHAGAAEAARLRVARRRAARSTSTCSSSARRTRPTRCSPTCRATATRRSSAAPSCAGSR